MVLTGLKVRLPFLGEALPPTQSFLTTSSFLVVVKLPQLTVRVKQELACVARDFVLTIDVLLVRERPPPGVRERCGDVDGVFAVGSKLLPVWELMPILLLLLGVLSPEGSLLVAVDDDMLKGDGEEGMLNCDEGVEGNKPTPAFILLPRVDFGVDGTEEEKKEERLLLLLGVFGVSMLKLSVVVVFEFDEVAETLPPPAVVAPLLLFPALLLLSTFAMDGEEPNISDDLPLPNTPAVAEAENLDPPAPTAPLLLPLFENPPLAAGRPFPLLRDSKCRENRAASFDTWVDEADDAIVVVDVVVEVAVADVVVVVAPETLLLLLPLMPPILLAPPPAAA